MCRFSVNVHCVRHCRCLYTVDGCWEGDLHMNACVVRRVCVCSCLICEAVVVLPHYSHNKLRSLVISINWRWSAGNNYVV